MSSCRGYNVSGDIPNYLVSRNNRLLPRNNIYDFVEKTAVSPYSIFQNAASYFIIRPTVLLRACPQDLVQYGACDSSWSSVWIQQRDGSTVIEIDLVSLSSCWLAGWPLEPTKVEPVSNFFPADRGSARLPSLLQILAGKGHKLSLSCEPTVFGEHYRYRSL